MIELDEKDVKAVGKSRFIRRHDKQLTIVLIGSMITIVLMTCGTSDFENFIRYIPLIPAVGLISYAVWYTKNLGKAGKELVAKWKEGK